MPQYTAIVLETRIVKCLYTVEAENEEQARELLEKGETTSESPQTQYEVTERSIEDFDVEPQTHYY